MRVSEVLLRKCSRWEFKWWHSTKRFLTSQNRSTFNTQHTWNVISIWEIRTSFKDFFIFLNKKHFTPPRIVIHSAVHISTQSITLNVHVCVGDNTLRILGTRKPFDNYACLKGWEIHHWYPLVLKKLKYSRQKAWRSFEIGLIAKQTPL